MKKWGKKSKCIKEEYVEMEDAEEEEAAGK